MTPEEIEKALRWIVLWRTSVIEVSYGRIDGISYMPADIAKTIEAIGRDEAKKRGWVEGKAV